MDKTSTTADSTDVVTVPLKHARDDAGVSGASVARTSTDGTLGVSTPQTGFTGGSMVRLTSPMVGSLAVTATVNGMVKTTEAIAFTAPVGS